MMDGIDVHLGRRLRRRRRILGLTQQQLAGACGVRFQQIQKYENGANRISFSRLVQISLQDPTGKFWNGASWQAGATTNAVSKRAARRETQEEQS